MTPQPLRTIHVLDRASRALWRSLVSLRLLAIITPLAVAVLAAGGGWPQVSRALGSGWMPAIGVYLPWSAGPADGLIWADLARLVLALAFAACLAQLVGALHPAWPAPGDRRPATADLTLPGNPPAAEAAVVLALGQGGHGVVRRLEVTRAGETEIQLLAGRRGVQRWLPAMAFVGALALLGAFGVASVWGWEGQPVTLLLGETHAADDSAGLDLRLEQVAVYPGTDGSVQRVESRVGTYRAGTYVGAVSLAESRPQVRQGVGLYQLGWVPSARVNATGGDGHMIGLQRFPADATMESVLRVAFPDARQEQLLFLPESDLVVHLVDYPSLPSMDLNRRVLHVQVSRASDGAPLAERYLTESGALDVGGTRIDVALEYGVTLMARRDPQRPLVWLGGVLLALGVLAVIVWPPRPMWIALRGAEGATLCRMAARRAEDVAAALARIEDDAAPPSDGACAEQPGVPER